MSKTTLSALAAIVDAYESALTSLCDLHNGDKVPHKEIALIKEARAELDRLRSTEAKPRVIVICSGGVVQGACSTVEDLEVEVLDRDELEEDGNTPEEIARLRALEVEADEMFAVY